MTGLDRIGVYLERIRAIFERVFDAADSVGQLLRLADRDKSSAERERDGRSEEITARFDADDDINRRFPVVILERIYRFAEALFIFQERGDVVEVDAGLWKSGTSRISCFKCWAEGASAADADTLSILAGARWFRAPRVRTGVGRGSEG